MGQESKEIRELRKKATDNPTQENKEALANALLEAMNISLPHTLTLKEPFEYGSKHYTEIVFHHPIKAHMVGHLSLDMGGVNGLTFQQLFPVIEKMTGEFTEVIEELGFEDMVSCVEVASYFLAGGQKTGAKQ